MRMRQLILQHLQQICDDIQPLRQETNSLVHLQIASHSLVDGLKLGLSPHQFGRVEDRALQVDVDAEDEELADLHVDFAAGKVDTACACDGGGNGLCCCDGCVNEILVQRSL